MAKMDYDITHKNANSLAITVPSTIQRNVLRCDDKGDQYAEAIYRSSGYYAKLANAFDKIAQYCNQALSDSGIAVDKVKTELKQAKSKALSQKSGCAKRQNEIKTQYNLTADIYTSMNEGK